MTTCSVENTTFLIADDNDRQHSTSLAWVT